MRCHEAPDRRPPLRATLTAVNRPKKTVLVVEDDAAIRRGLVDSLQFAGYTVIASG
jgi:CheY-like chemotaxis protein